MVGLCSFPRIWASVYWNWKNWTVSVYRGIYSEHTHESRQIDACLRPLPGITPGRPWDVDAVWLCMYKVTSKTGGLSPADSNFIIIGSLMTRAQMVLTPLSSRPFDFSRSQAPGSVRLFSSSMKAANTRFPFWLGSLLDLIVLTTCIIAARSPFMSGCVRPGQSFPVFLTTRYAPRSSCPFRRNCIKMTVKEYSSAARLLVRCCL